MACVFLAEAIQCTCDRKAATGSFNKGPKIKLTTALLSGGWVPVIPRSFHFWQPASHGWEILATQPRAPKWQGRKQTPVTLRTSVEKGREETTYKLSHNICDTPTLNKARYIVKVAKHTKMAEP